MQETKIINSKIRHNEWKYKKTSDYFHIIIRFDENHINREKLITLQILNKIKKIKTHIKTISKLKKKHFDRTPIEK